MQRLEHSLAAPKWPDSKPGFRVYTLVDFLVGSLPRGFPPVLGFPCLKIQNFNSICEVQLSSERVLESSPGFSRVKHLQFS